MTEYAVICTEPFGEEWGDGAEIIYQGPTICPPSVEGLLLQSAVENYCSLVELEGSFENHSGFPDKTWRFEVKNLETGDIVTMTAETFFEPYYRVRRVDG